MASVTVLQADAAALPLADQSVDLVFGSPPYTDCRTYDDGTLPPGHVVKRGTLDWVEWMLDVTTEAVRVCRGPVLWVIGCPTRKKVYQPAAEGLAWEWFKRGGHAFRPVYWHRYGIPGSGGRQWFRADIEYVLAFKRPGDLPWSDNTAMGRPPKYGVGGAMSNRTAEGQRINQAKYGDPWGKRGRGNNLGGRRANGSKKVGTCAGGSRRPNGERKEGGYTLPVLANPGNLVSTGAGGGGQLGSKLAHENEAPFPEDLAEWFIRSLCPPGGTVLDPFSGSGTTIAVARRLGRNGIGTDIRASQVALSTRRVRSVQQDLLAAEGSA